MIAIVGAGRVGAYVGARLALAGHDVLLVGRRRFADDVAAHGLTALDSSGPLGTLRPARVRVTTDIRDADGADTVLVAVKSRDTAAVAGELAGLSGAPTVVSLQNGLRNVRVLRDGHPGPVVAGMVPFNVVTAGPGRFRQTTRGRLVLGPGGERLAADCSAAGLPATVRADVEAVQRGKLVVNLNNAVQALSGLDLADELADRRFRAVLAAAQREAVRVFRAAGLPLRSPVPLPPRMLPLVLRLPTPLFTAVTRRTLDVSPGARSSMSDDLLAGRPTEVDELNGEVVRVAAGCSVPAPVNAALVELVHEAEATGTPPAWPPAALIARVLRP